MQGIRGSDTSVHIGCFTNDYNLIQTKDPELIPKYHATGSSAAVLANRISWYFDLRGPSVTVDTACSSSLVALDQACQMLRSNQANMVSMVLVYLLVCVTTRALHTCHSWSW
jgi:acyl transferase domain-containing protein